MMKKLKVVFATLLSLYVLGCGYLYFFQESMIFKPTKAEKGVPYVFPSSSKEMIIRTADGQDLYGIVAKSQQEVSKGLIFYMHGNKGNLNNQVVAANFYTDLGYDFFSFDYRSFGKSTGELINEEQFFKDVQLAYDSILHYYNEKDISVIGYSVGTASAAMIAAQNHPKKLMLLAPYYSLIDMTQRRYKIVPSFLLKYPFETNKYLMQVSCPVLLIHGTEDSVLPYEGSKALSQLLKPNDTFVTIVGQGHVKFEDNQLFVNAVNNFFK